MTFISKKLKIASTPKTRCAVLGVGYLGRFHAQKYALSAQAELVAVCDNDFNRAKAVALEFGCRAFEDASDLIGIVDAVSIAAPTKMHHVLTKFALEHGLHVLVEKPITVSLIEAQEITLLAQQKGLILQVGHLERFNPVVSAIAESAIKPRFIESHRLAPYKPRGADVNVVLDLMIHDVDIVLYLNKSPVRTIQASGASVISKAIDIANARLEFENGCVANITASRVSSKSERMMRVFTDGAYVALDLQHKKMRQYSVSDTQEADGVPLIQSETRLFDSTDALALEIESFLDSIRNEKPVAITGIDGINALRAAIIINELIAKKPNADNLRGMTHDSNG
jgi:predicted dehydrogenase